MADHGYSSVLAIGKRACVALAVTWIGMPAWGQLETAPPTVAPVPLDTIRCGTIENAYGPYDYRRDRDKLPIVEGAHFTAEVEGLIRGNRGYLGGDLDYTLRAFPNHHRALLAMMRYGQRLKLPKVPSANYDVECYFLRAMSFRPDDTTVRAFYAIFLHHQRRQPEAIYQLDAAARIGATNSFTQYNVGLTFLEIGEPDRALTQAHRASAMGFDRLELKARLQAAGKWVEPDTGAAITPSGVAGAASQP